MSHPIIPLVPSDTVWLIRGPGTAKSLSDGRFGQVYAAHGYKVAILEDSRDPAVRAQYALHNIKTLIREGDSLLPLQSRARNLSQKGDDHTVVVGLSWEAEDARSVRPITVHRNLLNDHLELVATYLQTVSPSTHEVNLEEERVSALQEQADSLLAQGLIEAAVDVRKWIDFRPLQAASTIPAVKELA
ncbi:MAG: hypothetical protein QM647_15400 [Asticcacaulis sp.]|uniref:hypothetical protein n=1 Tax=Asticcacaulis sp. TaxID=1872648 RepID=UPI0039E26BE2